MANKSDGDNTYSYTDGEVLTGADLNDTLPVVSPPIGSVIAWLKSLGTTHTPTLPDGWVECDGSVLSDADSPYNGDTIPNLNGGTYRFLKGHTSSGVENVATTHTHSYQGSGSAAGDGSNRDTFNTGTNITHTSSNNSAACEPANYTVVWIMRVK